MFTKLKNIFSKQFDVDKFVSMLSLNEQDKFLYSYIMKKYPEGFTFNKDHKGLIQERKHSNDSKVPIEIGFQNSHYGSIRLSNDFYKIVTPMKDDVVVIKVSSHHANVDNSIQSIADEFFPGYKFKIETFTYNSREKDYATLSIGKDKIKVAGFYNLKNNSRHLGMMTFSKDFGFIKDSINFNAAVQNTFATKSGLNYTLPESDIEFVDDGKMSISNYGRLQ